MLLKTMTLSFLVLASTARADESIRLLKVNDDVYTNVTVTMVTPTDIYFTHAHGLASAKLKDLDPGLQKHFHFNAARSARIEQANVEATADFRAKLVQEKTAAFRPVTVTTTATNVPLRDGDTTGPDFVVDMLNARSIRGHAAPPLAVEKWLTDQPATDGQLVMTCMLATSDSSSKQSIPLLNGIQKDYRGRLVIIGVNEDPEREVLRVMPPDSLEFATAVDTQARMKRELEVTTLPYCILIDPTGIVRFEGNPMTLSGERLNQFLLKYLNGEP